MTDELELLKRLADYVRMGIEQHAIKPGSPIGIAWRDYAERYQLGPVTEEAEAVFRGAGIDFTPKVAKESFTDCRTETGITVSLVDAIIVISRVLAQRDLSAPETHEALKDISSDKDVWAILHPPAAPAQDTGSGERLCTCHPSDNPPVPCAQKYALSECVASVQPETKVHTLRYSLYSNGVTWCDECKQHVYILDKGHARK